MLFVAIPFRTRTSRLLKSTFTSVTYLLYAFVLLLVNAKGLAAKLVSGGVVLRSTYDAVVNALEFRLSEREKQLEDCRNALKRSNDTLESTNRSFAELDDRIVQLKKENEHFKQLLNAEKQKNHRHSY
ncbi:hypothetical protein AAVH_40606 [Aphelenchoides avenae]|nr:hypothetical protein AAVH_40606 [Aphelenchus avenae]